MSQPLEFCIGFISEYDPVKGLVRVELAEDDDGNGKKLVTPWLPYVVKKSYVCKEMFPWDIQEQVALVIDWDEEKGVVLGSLYNDSDTPPSSDANTYMLKFQDGSIISFNRDDSDYIMDMAGRILVNAADDIKISSNTLIEFNGGGFGGLVKVNPLLNKINALEQEINALKNIFTTWIPVPQDGGALLKTTAATWAGQLIAPLTTLSDLEDTAVTH